VLSTILIRMSYLFGETCLVFSKYYLLFRKSLVFSTLIFKMFLSFCIQMIGFWGYRHNNYYQLDVKNDKIQFISNKHRERNYFADASTLNGLSNQIYPVTFWINFKYWSCFSYGFFKSQSRRRVRRDKVGGRPYRGRPTGAWTSRGERHRKAQSHAVSQRR